ncbi:uncharacterized protein LOC128985132 [Macrosteles quadrilineatus]|uniref:uncharacterized protein LOC128985132 n=1 Tax=Macrosteles quadrilineatus TaxID=74068 RepID=UPI0023E1AC46|nr:uncharacterized protein LOC128985132 [Macrosteles quadrilineatus]
MVEMSRSNLQILATLTMVTASWGHLLDLDGYHHWRYNLPHGPHPLDVPPVHLPPLRSALPPLPLHPPPQIILVPVHVRGTFPPFIERIVQRIQTWWSFYNPPEELTRPPPTMDEAVTTKPNSSKKKPTIATTTPVPKQEAETESTPEASETPQVETTTSTPETSDPTVSTLAVFEVTPSGSAPSEETEEPMLITPERASLLGGQKEAYLRFLQTGTIPPYLESDIINETEE